MRNTILALTAAATILTSNVASAREEWVVPLVGGVILGTIVGDSRANVGASIGGGSYGHGGSYSHGEIRVQTGPSYNSGHSHSGHSHGGHSHGHTHYEGAYPVGPVYQRYERYDHDCHCTRVWNVRVQ